MTMSWLAERKATSNARTLMSAQVCLGSDAPRRKSCRHQGDLDGYAPTTAPPQGERRGQSVDQRRPKEFQCVESADQSESANRSALDAGGGEPGGERQIGEHQGQTAGETERQHLEHVAVRISCQRTPPAGHSLCWGFILHVARKLAGPVSFGRKRSF